MGDATSWPSTGEAIATDNLPSSRLEQLAIEIPEAHENLGRLYREARDECQVAPSSQAFQDNLPSRSFRDWLEENHLSVTTAYREMNEDPDQYNPDHRKKSENVPLGNTSQSEPVHIPEYVAGKAPADVWTEAADKVVSLAPPKDRAMVREETLVIIYRALPDLDTAEAFDRVIAKCEEHKQTLIDVGPAPNTRSELNHTQFPQHGERRHVP